MSHRTSIAALPLLGLLAISCGGGGGGAATTVSGCTEGTCPDDQVCLAGGRCGQAECTEGADCGPGQSCESGACVRDVAADRDGDGIPDLQDSCPEVSNAQGGDVDGDGRGDACDGDADGDGVPNGSDLCPFVFQTDPADADGDGIGNACDEDFDGVSVRGRLTSTGPADPSEATLTLLGPGVERQEQPGSDGSFLFDDAISRAGLFQVVVAWPGQVASPPPFYVDLEASEVDLMEIEARPRAEGGDAVSLVGRVQRQGEGAHGGVTVHLRAHPSGDLLASTFSDEGGYFALRASPDLTYQLEFASEGYQGTSVAPVSYEGGSFVVDGEPVDVELTPVVADGSLRVEVVVLPDVIPASQRRATVTLRGVEDDLERVVGAAGEGAPATFDGLPSGRYLVEATREGFSAASVEVAVDAGGPAAEVELEVRLESLEAARLDLNGVSLDVDAFAGVDLSGADLSGVTFASGASLSCADLSGADLSLARLDDADLRGVDLSGARLFGTSLSGADLRGARMVGVDATGADLSGASLGQPTEAATCQRWPSFEAPMRGASFYGASLRGAEVVHLDMEGVNLGQADLSEATLRDVEVIGVQADGVDLSGATLTRVDATGASMPRALLVDTVVASSTLDAADLREASLDRTRLGCVPRQGVVVQGCDDRYEPNNTTDQAALLTPGLYEGLTACGNGAIDNYGVELEAGQTLEVFLESEGAKDYQLLLFGAGQQTLDVGSGHLGPYTAEADGVLGFRVQRQEGESGYRLLVKVDGVGVECPEGTITTMVGARLDRASVEGAALDGVDARGSSWVDARLDVSPRLGDVPPPGCVLDDSADGCSWGEREGCTELPEACTYVPTSVVGADLDGARLTGSRWSRVRAYQARLSGALLDGALLQGTTLIDADLSEADLNGANLSGNSAIGSDLSGVDLAGVQMRNARLWEVRLSDCQPDPGCQVDSDCGSPELAPRCVGSCTAASLRGADLTGAVLQRAHATGVDAAGAVMRGSDLSEGRWAGALLYRADLTGAQARFADFSRAVMSEANLNDASFEDVDMGEVSGANLSAERASIRRATLREAQLCGSSFRGVSASTLDAVGANLQGVDFTGADVRIADFDEAGISGATFARASGQGTSFDGAIGMDVRFDGAELPGSSWVDVNLNKALIRDADLGGADFTDANLQSADLSRTRAVDIVANRLWARRASFDGADLEGGTWNGADLEEASFAGADMTEGSLFGTALVRVDFSDADLEGIQWDGEADWSGVTFSPSTTCQDGRLQVDYPACGF